MTTSIFVYTGNAYDSTESTVPAFPTATTTITTEITTQSEEQLPRSSDLPSIITSSIAQVMQSPTPKGTKK